MKELTLNLSLCRHPCVDVAAIVVSEMKERLSPKREPPTTKATRRGSDVSVDCAIPVAMGVSATMVPTLVPMEREIKQAPRNRPAISICSGKIWRASDTVASIHPVSRAV